jgi:hypothetical protein
MEAVIDRLESDSADVDMLIVGRKILRALNERHLLIAVKDDAVAEVLARFKWDGAVQTGTHDFLMAVDSNMGYTKANFYIQQAMTYTVDLRDPTVPKAVLTVRYTHTFPHSKPCQYFGDRERRTVDEFLYAYHTRQCYWNYLRVLLPAGSQLTGIQRPSIPDEWGLSDLFNESVHLQQGTADTYMLSTLLVVPPGSAQETVFRYQLPPAVLRRTDQGWQYRLALQKQAGREAIPVTVKVHLPSGATVMTAAPVLDSQNEQGITWNVELATDQLLEVVFAEDSARIPEQPQGTMP